MIIARDNRESKLTMEDYEQLGVFYLGKKYDLDKESCLNELVLYESRDLVTHAVCVGMTGSGKTGLCIDLLEEAAIDNIPIIAVDPKGDLANLLLNFPDLEAESFLPWVDHDEARRLKITPEELSKREAQRWKDGLAQWHQEPQRIRDLKEAAEFQVYTPASNAGVPLSILKSFDCPAEEILEDRELLREQISVTATSILALLGIESDPLKSREHILLSAIFNKCWKNGENLELHGIIEKIQNPPVEQVGVVPLESFFPKKERFELSMQLNNLLASPGFEAWLEGEALDIDKLFYNAEGKNKVSIISIAHLAESERMFFVSLLLTQLLSWMRRQSGTSSLRAIFYMDEILGYFPPVANPPSKAPLITLLKQARAFGLGLVLATQNPVDLDYKALGNTGTWFIGRLQTERDKMRVLEGLENTASNAGSGSFNRAQVERLISSLSRQVFLLSDVHREEPCVFKTRWSLSYLRGPLSRAQLKLLHKDAESGGKKKSAEESEQLSGDGAKKLQKAEKAPAAKSKKPILDPQISEFFVKVASDKAGDKRLVYKPMIFASCQLSYSDARSGIDHLENFNCLSLIKPEPQALKWEKSFMTAFGVESLSEKPEDGIEFAPLPSAAAEAGNYKQWSKEFVNYLIEERKLEVLRCPVTGEYSKPKEGEREFRIRLQQAAREKRDLLVQDLTRKYEDKAFGLQERLRKARQTLEKEMADARSAQLDSALSVGSSIFQALVGRKVVSSTNIRRASSAIKKAGQAGRQQEEVDKAQETVDSLESKLGQLEADFTREMTSLKARLDPASQDLEKLKIALKKSKISLNRFCLAWAPCLRQEDGKVTLAW